MKINHTKRRFMKSIPFKIVKKAKIEHLDKMLNVLTTEIRKATKFVKDIENGDLVAEYDITTDSLLEKEENLSAALLSMRDKMKQISEEENERNWTTEGLAKFVEILRSNTFSIKELSNHILSNLIQYLKANQGYLFLVNNIDQQDVHLELAACYAYSKKKHLEQRIEIGEGMVGQCYLEKETIFLTEIPQDYLKITSGLGESLPGNVVIVPLKMNDEVWAILEIASFHVFKKYQVDFLEKLGESIASTISTAKVTEKTQKLLEESQVMTEQMRSQEEEMRQNMEELTATQEEMKRKQTDMNEANSRFDLVNKSSTEGMWDLKFNDENSIDDTECAQAWFSDQFYNILGHMPGEFVAKVSSWIDRIHPEDMDRVMEAFYAHLRDEHGKIPFDIDYKIKISNGSYRWVKSRGTTLRNQAGKSIRTAGSMKDIHEEVMSLEKITSALNEVKQKENYTKNILNATDVNIFTIDSDMKIDLFNEAFSNTVTKLGLNLEKGSSAYIQSDPEYIKETTEMFKAIMAGNGVEIVKQIGSLIFNFNYSPMMDIHGQVIGICCFATDVTQKEMIQEQTRKLLADTQHQAEELKAQQEEMRQNMEELNATQEELQRKNNEVENIRRIERERSDNQIESQKKVMENFVKKFKEREADYKRQIEELGVSSKHVYETVKQ